MAKATARKPLEAARTAIAGLQDAAELVRRAWNAGLTPPPSMSLSEWADANFVLGGKETEPGPWRTDRTPYLREPMDCLSPQSDVREVVIMKGAQLGFTKMLLAWICMIIHIARAETMVVLPSMKTCDTWLARQLAPALSATPVMRGLLSDGRGKGGKPAKFMKHFGAYALIATWSSSAATLKSNNAPNVVEDELDSFVANADGEGPPEDLIAYRQQNFASAKTGKVSTPSAAETSRILKAYKKGDERRYFLPCPLCGHFQLLTFDRFVIEPEGAAKPAEVTGAHFRCVSCNGRIEESAKSTWYERGAAQGAWIPTKHKQNLLTAGFPASSLADLLEEKERAARDVITASFQISTFYAPLGWDGASWPTIARDWLAKRGNSAEEFTFRTHTLGEPVEVKGDMPEHRLIMARAEATPMQAAAAMFDGANGTIAEKIPAGGLVLNATVDVQGAGYLACELRAWGRNRESWSVGYFLIDGDPAKEEVWKRLAAVVERQYPHELGGTLPLSAMAIDCGYRPEPVYAFARKYARPLVSGQSFRIVSPRTVIPVRGGADQVSLIQGWSTAQEAQKRFGLYVLTVSGHMAKLSIYDRLRLDTPAWTEDRVFPRGYIHLPRYDEDYYRGIVAEKLVMAEKTGRLTWVKVFDRNEPLDCAVYHEGLAEVQQLSARTEAQWASIERGLSAAAGVTRQVAATAEEETFEVEPSYQDNW